MTRTIWTLFAGFVLGLYAVFFAAVHSKTFRKPVIDMVAKFLVDWIHGTAPEQVEEKISYKYGAKSFNGRPSYNPHGLLDLTVPTHQNTVGILLAMEDNIHERGYFTVADLKSAASLPTTFEDMQYGWKTVQGVLYFAKDTPGEGWKVETRKHPDPIR